MNNALDIKPGQKWVLRDGGKARIYATDGRRDYVIHGAYETEDGWLVASWRTDGAYDACVRENDRDLIRLYDWREELAPIWAVLNKKYTHIAMDAGREWFCYERAPKCMTRCYCGNGSVFVRMDPLFNMPDPDCDWTETLTMRPEA